MLFAITMCVLPSLLLVSFTSNLLLLRFVWISMHLEHFYLFTFVCSSPFVHVIKSVKKLFCTTPYARWISIINFSNYSSVLLGLTTQATHTFKFIAYRWHLCTFVCSNGILNAQHLPMILLFFHLSLSFSLVHSFSR